MFGAVPEPDERNIRPRLGGRSSDISDLELARYYLVTHAGHDPSRCFEALPPLVGNQDAKLFRSLRAHRYGADFTPGDIGEMAVNGAMVNIASPQLSRQKAIVGLNPRPARFDGGPRHRPEISLGPEVEWKTGVPGRP
jgi:hypothetical protein